MQLLNPAISYQHNNEISIQNAQIDAFEREVVEMVKPCHGTTTLGFIFKGGVIIAVDSRATMGSYICECGCGCAVAFVCVFWEAVVDVACRVLWFFRQIPPASPSRDTHPQTQTPTQTHKKTKQPRRP
jgi:hypothetical protein